MIKKFKITTFVIFIIMSHTIIFPQSFDSTRANSLTREGKASVEKNQASLKLAEKAYSEALNAGNKRGQADALFLLGTYWKNLLEYSKASECLFKSQELYEELKDNIKIARNFLSLGDLNRAIAEYDMAIGYSQKALRLFEMEQDKSGIAKCFDRLAATFYETTPSIPGNIDSVFIYVEKSLMISRSIKDDTLTSSSMNILGAAYSVIKKYDLALAHLKDALKFAVEKNILNDAALIRTNLAFSFYSMGDYHNAIEYAKQAYDYAEENKILPYIDMSTLCLFRSYYKLSDYQNAYKYMEIYDGNRWRLYDENRMRQIRALEVKYNSEKREIELANQKKVVFLEIIVFSFLLLAAVLVVSFYRYRNKLMKKKNIELEKKNLFISEQNVKLTELNATKDKFFSIIGHDLKNPYQSLLGFSHILINDYEELSEKEIKEFVGYIFEASDMGNRLLQNLLDWSRSETGVIKYEPQEFHLNEIINQAVNLASNTAMQKDISLKNEIDETVQVYCDRNMIYTVLRNLVSNAIKFSYRGGTVRITSKVYDNTVEVSIIDKGMGMNELLIEDLFKIEKRITNNGTEDEKGTGLGLYLCKEFIEKNHGSITVKSEVGKGSAFIFTLPASANA